MLLHDEQEMLARCKAATQGPWKWKGAWMTAGDKNVFMHSTNALHHYPNMADRALIKTVPTDLPEVLRRIGELREASIRLLCAFANAPLDPRGLEAKERMTQCLLDPKAAQEAREAYCRGDYKTTAEFIAEIKKTAAEQ